MFFPFQNLQCAGAMIGSLIAGVRHEQGLSQAELAGFAETTRSYISKLERGRVTSPGADKLFRIIDVLGISQADIAAWVEAPGAPPGAVRVFDDFLRLGTEDRAYLLGLAAECLGEADGRPRNRGKTGSGDDREAAEAAATGARIRAFRMRRRLTQAQLARAAKIDRRHVSAIETGRIRSPSLDLLAAFASALGVELPELAGPGAAPVPEHLPEDMLMLQRYMRLEVRDRKRIRKIIAERLPADGNGQ